MTISSCQLSNPRRRATAAAILICYMLVPSLLDGGAAAAAATQPTTIPSLPRAFAVKLDDAIARAVRSTEPSHALVQIATAAVLAYPVAGLPYVERAGKLLERQPPQSRRENAFTKLAEMAAAHDGHLR